MTTYTLQPTLQNVVCDATDRCIIQAASSAPSQSLFFMIHPQHFLEAPGSWFPQFPVSSAACPAHCSRHKLVRHAILATYWILKILVATDCLQLGTALLIQSIIAHCISVLWCTAYLNLNVLLNTKVDLVLIQSPPLLRWLEAHHTGRNSSVAVRHVTVQCGD